MFPKQRLALFGKQLKNNVNKTLRRVSYKNTRVFIGNFLKKKFRRKKKK